MGLLTFISIMTGMVLAAGLFREVINNREYGNKPAQGEDYPEALEYWKKRHNDLVEDLTELAHDHPFYENSRKELITCKSQISAYVTGHKKGRFVHIQDLFCTDKGEPKMENAPSSPVKLSEKPTKAEQPLSKEELMDFFTDNGVAANLWPADICTSKLIRQLRINNNLSIRELAEITGIGKSQMHRIETAAVKINPVHLAQIFRAIARVGDKAE